MKLLFKTITALSLASVGLFTYAEEAVAQKPNIIFIIADDLGYSDLSCYGQKSFPTPHIDQLADSGVRFTRHYSGATVCSPSRASLMTGRDGGHVTVRGNGAYTIGDEEITVSEIAKQADYNTAMIGKSCVTGNTQTPETVLASGFDYFYGTTDHRDGHYRYPKFVYKNTERIEFPKNKLHTGTHYDGNLYTDEALGYIAKQDENTPFFMILSYPIPHASVLAPEEDLVAARTFVKKEVAAKKSKHYTATNEVKANYIAMITIMDKAVGAIRSQLEEQNLLDNTIIVFTSDNGPSSEGGTNPELLDSNGPLRGGKRDLYEGGIRIPFIASWPAAIQAGQVTDHPSAFWDFLPTVCELTDQSIPTDIQGVSYFPTLLGKGEQNKHQSLYWEFHEKGGRRAIQQGDWKLVQYNVNAPNKTTTELFNLANDIGETTDLSLEYSDKVIELLELMDNARVPSENFPNKILD